LANLPQDRCDYHQIRDRYTNIRFFFWKHFEQGRTHQMMQRATLQAPSRQAHGITASDAIAIYQAKARKTHHTGSELALLYGVSPKAIRDVWNLRSWSLATEPYWCDKDRAKHAGRLQGDFHDGSASAGARSPSSDAQSWACPSPSTSAHAAASSKVPHGNNVHISLNGLDDWVASLRTLEQVRQSCPSSAALEISPRRIEKRSLEDGAGHALPAKVQCAGSTCNSAARTSWCDLVVMSTTESFEQAAEMLCLVNTSCSQFHLFDHSSGVQVLKCSMDCMTMQMCSGPGKDTVVAVTTTACATISASQVPAATVYLRLFDIRACQDLVRRCNEASGS